MAARPKPTPSKAGPGIVVIDAPHAPVIYFDGAANFGVSNGVVNITLAFARHMSAADHIATDFVAAAHLRCTVQVAMELRKAIDDILLLAAPASAQSN